MIVPGRHPATRQDPCSRPAKGGRSRGVRTPDLAYVEGIAGTPVSPAVLSTTPTPSVVAVGMGLTTVAQQGWKPSALIASSRSEPRSLRAFPEPIRGIGRPIQGRPIPVASPGVRSAGDTTPQHGRHIRRALSVLVGPPATRRHVGRLVLEGLVPRPVPRIGPVYGSGSAALVRSDPSGTMAAPFVEGEHDRPGGPIAQAAAGSIRSWGRETRKARTDEGGQI